MNKNLSPWFQASFLTCLSLLIDYPVTAQSISSDGTLPTPTEVTPTATGVEINGGTTRGENLFHSFKDFSVLSGSEAFFNNAPDVVNILNRVTGGNISSIDGLLRANGSANLFLINPAGIILGENTSLNIGGSFYGSTADSILFPDGVEFSATNTQAEPLLTIKAPIGLSFRNNPSDIVGKDIGTTSLGSFAPGVEQNLALVGGDISLKNTTIGLAGGKITIGGLTSEGIVGINNDGSLNFPQDVLLANITLTDALLFLETLNKENNVGNIEIKGNNISLNNSVIASVNSLENGGDAGNIVIDTNFLSLANNSFIGSATFGEGNTGSVIIQDAEKVILDFSIIRTFTEENGIGNSGDIVIKADEFALTGDSLLDSSTFGQGDAGNINIEVGDIELDFATINSQVGQNAVGNGGDINISTTGSFLLTGDSFLSTRTFGLGSAGNVNIETADSLALDSSGNFTGSLSIFSFVRENARGDAGDINIQAGSLALTDGAQINASTFGEGNAGSIKINASGTITVDGEGSDGFSSGIFSNVRSTGVGNAGGIDIATSNLTLTNGGQINAGTFGEGSAGNINLDVNDAVTLSNNGEIFGNVGSGALGEGGTVNINAGSLSIADEASSIRTSTFGLGSAGNVILNVDETINISGGNIFSNVEAGGVGDGGNVTINAGSLYLTDGGQIRTSVLQDGGEIPGGRGNAGNVLINVDGDVILSGVNQDGFSSGIVSFLGTGTIGSAGDISISANSLTLENSGRINSSTFGEGNAGNISLQVADSLTVTDSSQITSAVVGFERGNGGDIDITANSLSLTNGGAINAFVFEGGEGNGGSIEINALDIDISGVDTEGLPSGLFANTQPEAEGDAGSIQVTASDFRIADGATVTTDSQGLGDGGNLLIQAEILMAQ
ncbi:filamentous haemagglutinin outer membrane protein [Stanieria sp. NIES-3757]|nr:filamentous haemagglutinin outer membrane protein [Stanieria sp. NIES-3757]